MSEMKSARRGLNEDGMEERCEERNEEREERIERGRDGGEVRGAK